ncbi:MAG: J domain-containing protein [Myxococcota bacterium]|nr:J domain-containing protein [Myxococcota bacterium]
MSELFAAVVSITRTQRGRFFWAAWWSGPPVRHPFRKPDASNGGASTYEDALREAEQSAGRALMVIEPRWARACVRSMRGMPPFTPAELLAAASPSAEHPLAPRAVPASSVASLWTVLGVEPRASVEEIKRAFRKRALTTHPDHGGDPAAFRALHGAYERALIRRAKDARRPKKR